jgi:hypothetical protein
MLKTEMISNVWIIKYKHSKIISIENDILIKLEYKNLIILHHKSDPNKFYIKKFIIYY